MEADETARRPVRVAAAGLLALAAAGALSVIGLAGTPAGAQVLPPTQTLATHTLLPPVTIGPTMVCYTAPNATVEVGQGMGDPCTDSTEANPRPPVTITSTTPRVCNTRTTTQSGEIYIEFDAPGTCSWSVTYKSTVARYSTTVVTPHPPAPHTSTRITGKTTVRASADGRQAKAKK